MEILCPFGCSARFKRRYLQQHKAHCPSLPPASPPPFSPPISGRDTPPLTRDAREINGHTITVSPAMVSAARTLSDLENAITRLYAQFIAYSESSASLRSFKHNLEHLYRTNTSAFYGLIAIVALFIIWVLSTPLLLMLKILVLFFVLYSTWYVFVFALLIIFKLKILLIGLL